MNLLDEIKLLWWVKGLLNGGTKMGNLMQKLDGLKSVAGLLMVVAYYALPNWGVHVPDVVLKIGTGVASAGLAHKIEKGTGLVSMALDAVKSALNAITAKDTPPPQA